MPALVLMTALLASGAAPRRPVVVTTDCGVGVDDEWAIAHLALSPAIDLKGIVTTHAPSLPAPAAESSARAARAMLDHLPLEAKPPVWAGSSEPLNQDGAPRPNAGVTFLIEQARGHAADDRLTVVVLGAATDVASALRLEESWADRVAIVAMGFDRWPEGGDPWNVRNDVRAWQILLASRAPIVVGDVAVTNRSLAMTRERARARIGGRGRAGSYLAGLLDRWLDGHPEMAARLAGDRGTWPIWDEVATAYLLGMTRTRTDPRPALRDDLRFIPSGGRGTIEWVTQVDAERLWADLEGVLDRAR